MKICKMARTSKIDFSDEQKAKFETEFDDIIKFVADGGTSGEHMAISSHVVGLDDLADDVPRVGLSIEDALMNAPRKRGRYFVVPQVVE